MHPPLRPSGLAGLTVLVSGALAACGGTATSTAPVTGPPTVSASASPPSTFPVATGGASSPTPGPGVLSIPQLDLSMKVPAGLSYVSYQIQTSGITSLDDQSGVAHKPLGQVALTTPDCPGGGTIDVTIWDTDPATLNGQGYGGTIPGADTHVGGRYLHIEGGDGFPPASCSAKTTELLQKLVASATSTSGT